MACIIPLPLAARQRFRPRRRKDRVTCRYLGDDVRTYPAYRDLDTDRPLEAAPGGSYEIAPAGGLDLPVPPQDGRWETAGEPADDDGPGEGSALPPFPLMAGPGTEDEEN